MDGITLDIPAGRMVGLIGPDGVGKSSLLSLLAGERAVQQGRVEALGGDMASAGIAESVCPHIAYMPQGLGKNLYPTLSVFENLDFFGRLFGQEPAERRRRIDELCRSHRPATRSSTRPAGKLSGGMKQKLGLCCALIHDPDLLILDEPTTGVDPLSRRQFWELIDRIRADRPGMSVMVATAYMDEAATASTGWWRWTPATCWPPARRRSCSRAPAPETSRRPSSRCLPEEKRTRPPGVDDPAAGSAASAEIAIEADGLTKRFGNFVAVDHVSFRIERGEIFGFLGSNGCGKSTTMKMLTGLLPPTEGRPRCSASRSMPNDIADAPPRRLHVAGLLALFRAVGAAEPGAARPAVRCARRPTSRQRVDEMLEPVRPHAMCRRDARRACRSVIRQRLSLAVAMVHRPGTADPRRADLRRRPGRPRRLLAID